MSADPSVLPAEQPMLEPVSEMTPTVIEVEQLGPKEVANVHRVPILPTIFDVIFLAIIAVLVIYVTSLLTPPQRGYICNDYSLRFHREKTFATVYVCAGVAAALLIVPVAIVELFRIIHRNGVDLQSFTILPRDIVIYLRRCCKFIGSCAIGLLMNIALCRLTKFGVGRLRPYFLDVCQPQSSDSAFQFCKQDRDSNRYITVFTCTGNAAEEFDARLSFFSLRASFLVHVAAYSAMYLHERLPYRLYCYTIRPLLEFSIVCAALYLSFALIAAHEHFVSDVAVSIFVGFLTAIYSAVHIARMFRGRNLSTNRTMSPTGSPFPGLPPSHSGSADPTAISGSGTARTVPSGMIPPGGLAPPSASPLEDAPGEHEPTSAQQNVDQSQKSAQMGPEALRPYVLSSMIGDTSKITEVDSVLMSNKV